MAHFPDCQYSILLESTKYKTQTDWHDNFLPNNEFKRSRHYIWLITYLRRYDIMVTMTHQLLYMTIRQGQNHGSTFLDLLYFCLLTTKINDSWFIKSRSLLKKISDHQKSHIFSSSFLRGHRVPQQCCLTSEQRIRSEKLFNPEIFQKSSVSCPQVDGSIGLLEIIFASRLL